jgi:lipopolysaccharide transport system permease protein
MKNVLVIEAGRADRHYWHDLWRYRELFQVLAWRDLAVRYKQTAIGVLWALIRPMLTMLVFFVVFGRIARLPSDGSAPYPLLVFAGLLPWTFFSSGFGEAANSLIINANLLSKVYFPRLIVPVASVVVASADFFIAFCIMLPVMAWFNFFPGWRIAALPFFVLTMIVTTLGPSLWIAALNVKYRDFRYVVPFVIQLGLYISPVGFSSNIVPDQWRLLYSLNPMVGVIDGFRWCLLGGQRPLYLPGLVVGTGIAVFCFWLGLKVFRRTEKSFADLI